MATERKRYFKFPDSTLREGWDDATMADMARIQSFMNTRRARDGLTWEEASDCWLSEQEAMLVTNTKRPHVALQRLVSLPLRARLASASAALEARYGRSGVRFKWPKWHIYQQECTRTSGKPRTQDAPPEHRTPNTDTVKTRLAPAGGARKPPQGTSPEAWKLTEALRSERASLGLAERTIGLGFAKLVTPLIKADGRNGSVLTKIARNIALSERNLGVDPMQMLSGDNGLATYEALADRPWVSKTKPAETTADWVTFCNNRKGRNPSDLDWGDYYDLAEEFERKHGIYPVPNRRPS